MSPLSAITGNKGESDTSLQSYTGALRRAVQLLVNLGIMDSPHKDLQKSVEDVTDRIKRNEISLYGKPLKKEDVKRELKEAYAELAELEIEKQEVDRKLSVLKAGEKYSSKLQTMKKSSSEV